MMFRAVVFLAGPSSRLAGEKATSWTHWQPQTEPLTASAAVRVYIADAGLQAFLNWYETLTPDQQACLESIAWCGDGDSLGKHGKEIRAHTAARFEGRWKEHLYSETKDFSDCAAITSLLEYDLRHAGDAGTRSAWIEVHGALGGRLDHEIVNLLEFSESLARMGCLAAYALGPDALLTTLGVKADLPQGERFSVTSLRVPSQAKVEIKGAQYSGSVFLRQASHGLSNVVQQPPLSVTPLNANEPVLLFRVSSADE
jgi:thiamine pyrophosphokinase